MDGAPGIREPNFFYSNGNALTMVRRLINKLFLPKTAAEKSARQADRKSDYERWSDKQNLSPGWDSRTKQLANLIEPGTSVIEFGAGRQVLKTYLPNNCAYTPSDLVDRGNGTIVCDLNSETLPEFQRYDIAVFSGVLEYINDLPRLLLYLSNYVNVILASYAVVETNKQDRRAEGWVNDYSSTQLIDIFEAASFHCERSEKWRSQEIYKFTKR